MNLYTFIFSFIFWFLTASISIEYGHFHGPLESVLLFIEMSAISSSSHVNGDANTFSRGAALTKEELSANICNSTL